MIQPTSTHPAIPATNEVKLQIVAFRLGDDEYGIDIHHVQEIIRVREITPVPNAPDFVNGVINQRGRIIPIVQLSRRLGLPEKPVNHYTRFVLLDILDNPVGIAVDSVAGVFNLPKNAIQATSELPENQRSTYITGVAKLDSRLILLLNLSTVLTFGNALLTEAECA